MIYHDDYIGSVYLVKTKCTGSFLFLLAPNTKLNVIIAYLTSIMGLYSRKIIAWTLFRTMEVSCIIDTINKAKARRSTELPLILHSDRGSQYVSREYRKAAAKIQLSYSKKAFSWDNACIESFHSMLKREWISRFKIRDYSHAYRLIFEYIESFYNT